MPAIAPQNNRLCPELTKPVFFISCGAANFDGKILFVPPTLHDWDEERSPGLSVLFTKLRSRLPGWRETLPVFATIIFFVYSWALFRMFYQVPSWLYYLTISDILTIAAYVLSVALFESLVMLGLVVLVSALYPPPFFRQLFVAQGTAWISLLAVGAVLLQRKIGLIYQLQLTELIVYPLLLIGLFLALPLAFYLLFRRWSRLRQLVEGLADRMTIFALLYLPFSLISLLIVLIRNLF